MKPLLHIGYHKTGSTFLQRCVFPEPGFSLVARAKALRPTFVEGDPFGFDARIARETFRSGIERAQREGLVPVLSAERLSGNPHSGGYDSKQIAERLVRRLQVAHVYHTAAYEIVEGGLRPSVRRGGVVRCEGGASPKPARTARQGETRKDSSPRPRRPRRGPSSPAGVGAPPPTDLAGPFG
jgi:hypothetical protein